MSNNSRYNRKSDCSCNRSWHECQQQCQQEHQAVEVTLVRGLAKKLRAHQACAHGLGLRKIGNKRRFDQVTPEISGMISKIFYLLKIEIIAEG